jgi:hypothetical protein
MIFSFEKHGSLLTTPLQPTEILTRVVRVQQDAIYK